MSEFLSATEFGAVAVLKNKLAPESSFRFSGDRAEQEFVSGKPFIVITQHNDMLSWISLVPVNAEFVLTLEQKHDKKIYPFVVFHSAVDAVPFLKDLAKKFSGNVIRDYSDALRVLSSVQGAGIGTCPEGSNCNFIYDDPVAKFTQHGLIKAALMTGANIFYLTIKQETPLSINLKIPFLDLLVEDAIGFKVPFWKPVKMIGVYDLYETSMTPEEFHVLSKLEQRQYVQIVSERIRRQMNERYKTIEI